MSTGALSISLLYAALKCPSILVRAIFRHSSHTSYSFCATKSGTVYVLQLFVPSVSCATLDEDYEHITETILLVIEIYFLAGHILPTMYWRVLYGSEKNVS